MTVETVFREFLSGRRTFAALGEALGAWAASSPSGLAEVEAVLADLVNAGRLPRDLAQILSTSLGSALRAASPAGGPADCLDPPTEILLSGQRAQSTPLPGTARRRQAGAPALPLPPAEPLQAQLDDAILSSLTDNFKTYRRGEQSKAKGAEASDNRQLDAALESFRGARLRRDAAKASEGSARVFDLSAEVASGGERPVGVGMILKGRFILDREIGRGGMGVVYRAVDRRRLEAAHQQPYVAVKLLSADMRRGPETFRALEAEARRVQELAHPNIVTIFDFDRDGSHLFIVMELLGGRPLDALIRDAGSAGIGFEGSRGFVTDICRGLAYAHERGVIHCDLKPANVFVLEAGGVKLLDFGLAIISRGGVAQSAALDGYTLAYASPEILEGAPRHPADDIYALGCLIYVAVTGRHPFGQASALEARDSGLKAERPGQMPGPAWKSLQRALSFERAKRPADAAAFAKAYFDTGLQGWFRR